MGLADRLVIITSIMLVCSCVAINHKEDLILEYVNKVKGDISIENIIDEYHPTARNDESAYFELKNILEQRRSYLNTTGDAQIIIKKVKRSSDHTLLKGLEESNQVYLIYLDEIEFIPVLIEDSKIASTILMSKGSKKYFLKL